MNIGIIVFAHGSSVSSANDSVIRIAGELARHGGHTLVETAFLEQSPPDLRAAVGKLVARGAEHIVVIPYFLTLGIHLQRDLPRIVAELTGTYKTVTIQVTPPLDGHPALCAILLDRASEALA